MNTINWPLFDKLRAHIAGLKPDEFDYASFASAGCGCVAAHHQALLGFPTLVHPISALKVTLGISDDEAEFIWGSPFVEIGESLFACDSGADGIREASRRLDLVASRYTRPTISTDLETTKAADRERAFLVRCMAVAAEPVEVE